LVFNATRHVEIAVDPELVTVRLAQYPVDHELARATAAWTPEAPPPDEEELPEPLLDPLELLLVDPLLDPLELLLVDPLLDPLELLLVDPLLDPLELLELLLPEPTFTLNELTASPCPPCQISKPASTSMRYHALLM
jgi:hypothetical protein